MYTMHMSKKIGIIGCGHIGKAILTGLLSAGNIEPSEIIISTPETHHLKKGFPKVFITTQNKKAVQAQVCFLAVRPKVVKEVIEEIRSTLPSDTLFVSVAACVTMKLLEKYFGKRVRLIRIMPNLGVAYGQGVIGFLVNKNISCQDKQDFQKIFAQLGLLLECKNDDEIDKVGMIAGSGPGYLTYFLDVLFQQAKHYGFSDEQSYQLVLQMAKGTFTRLGKEKIPFSEFAAGVATKGGITEEVLKTWEENKFPQIISAGMKNGYAKIKRITKELELV